MTVGLLLRPDAYLAETSDGAYLLTHEGESALIGPSVYQLIDRLAPFLDGTHTLAELTADLPPGRQEMVRKLITVLLDRAVVRDVGHGGVVRLGPAGDQPEIAYVGYFRDSPNQIFREYRDQMTLVIGTGRLCRAVAVAATRSGLDHVVTAAACPTDLTGVDLVLHACDRSALEHTRGLDQLCERAGVPFAGALALDDQAWIGGCATVGVTWSSCWRRLLARRSGATKQVTRDGFPSSAATSGLAATVVANQLVHGVFRSITGADRPLRNRMTRVDLSMLTSEVCSVVRHPFAEPVSDPVKTGSSLRDGARVAVQTLSERAVVCAGDHVGVFGIPTEREFAQIPLHVCEIELSDPVCLLDPAGPATKVIGAGPDFATARHQATLKAFACYASLMIDPRRLDVLDGRPVDAHGDPDRMLSALKNGRSTGMVRGYGVADGSSHLVDVTRVFPALRPIAAPYQPPTGVAAAYDWQEAVARGLTGHCLRMTMNDLTASASPFPWIDLAGAVLDARGHRYRAMLGVIGDPVTVYDVTGPLGVPTMVCYLGSTPAGHASSLSAADALTDALEQALLRYQARVNGQPDYAPSPIRAIPDRLLGSATRPLSDGQVRDMNACAIALAKRGHRVIVVPLDHDPEVNAIMPYTVHVVVDSG